MHLLPHWQAAGHFSFLIFAFSPIPHRRKRLLAVAMGNSVSSEVATLRSTLSPPFSGSSAAAMGVVGTYSLDVEVEDTCFSTHRSSAICCGAGRGEFRVPWPCHCFGADCCCCPHSPRGAAWGAALAGGFHALLLEAGHMVARSADQRYSAVGVEGQAVHAPQNLLLANARQQLLAGWLPRANAFLLPYGLSCRAFNWVEDRRDDKGNKTGEVLRCAVQFYAQPAHGAPLLPGTGSGAPPGVVVVGGAGAPALPAAGYGSSVPAQSGAYFPPPPQQQLYYQGGEGATGAPKTV